jgi:hypothetical protein
MRLIFWPSASSVLAACLLLATTARAADAPALRLNDIVTVGTHNSYKQAIPRTEYALFEKANPRGAQSLDYAHRTLTEQLEAGARQLELDIVLDPQGGRYADPLLARQAGTALPRAWRDAMSVPGLKVMHVPDQDFRSSCVMLRDCLQEIRAWSRQHPQHVPILIMINAKDSGGVPGGVPLLTFDGAAYDAVDAAFREGLGRDALITPDEVQGAYPTLREAVLANAWPTLEQSRGRFLVALDESPEKVAVYRGQRRSLEGRAMFANAEPASPAAAYLTLNDPYKDADQIRTLVSQGFIVRTRADEGTWQARRNDIDYKEKALASGAQWVSTDYLWPDARLAGGFQVRLPGNVAALCNPVRIPAGCKEPLERPSGEAH